MCRHHLPVGYSSTHEMQEAASSESKLHGVTNHIMSVAAVFKITRMIMTQIHAVAAASGSSSSSVCTEHDIEVSGNFTAP